MLRKVIMKKSFHYLSIIMQLGQKNSCLNHFNSACISFQTLHSCKKAISMYDPTELKQAKVILSYFQVSHQLHAYLTYRRHVSSKLLPHHLLINFSNAL